MTCYTFLFWRFSSRAPIWIALLPFLLLFSGCVHELPVGLSDVEVNLHLQFDYELPQYKIVDLASKNDTEPAVYPYDARYHVWVFPVVPEGESLPDAVRVPVLSYSFTGGEVEQLDRDVPIGLPRGQWDVLVWTDFVPDGSSADWFWDTSSPAAITVRSEHLGGNDFRTAYGGRLRIDTRGYLTGDAHMDAVVPMERPVAKFNFVSADLNRFREMYPGADILHYSVEFAYNGFMASVYNLFTDRTVDSKQGQRFSSAFTVSESGDVQMGFDYVLVGTRETSVEMNLALYGPSGESLGGTSAVFVPLLRSHLTTVRGNFLSGSSQSGVAIDPAFDGDMNIYVQ